MQKGIYMPMSCPYSCTQKYPCEHLEMMFNHTPTSPKTWRKNIFQTLNNFGIVIVPVIGNAIDAAYTAGLDDREEAFKAGEALGQQNGMRMVVDMIPNYYGEHSHETNLHPIKQQIKDKYNL